jgi:hypothetical protein
MNRTRKIGNIGDVSCGPSDYPTFYVGGNQGGYDLDNSYQGLTHINHKALIESEIQQNYNALKSRFGL